MKPGDRLPDLRGVADSGDEVRLRDLEGKWVVVYFYPKDSTPGCTLEAQQFRDLHEAFAQRHAIVLGVSRDSLQSHCNFKRKQSMGFDLISDSEEIWCRAFDVIREKVLYGKRHMGIVRSTFLFAPEGRLVREWRGVKVAGHAAEVLSAVRESRS